jgi:O-antigen ligase
VIAFIAAGLLLLSWLQPNHFLPWVSWHSEGLVFLLVVLVAVWGAARAAAEPNLGKVAIPYSVAPLLAVALLAWIQTATGRLSFAGDALTQSFYLALSIACFSLGFADSKRNGHLTVLAGTLIAGALLSFMLLMVQALDLYEDNIWVNRMLQYRRPGANLGQPNQLATLLLMAIASVVYLVETKKWSRYCAALASVVLIVGLAATESRTGAVSLGALAVCWLAWRRRLGSSVTGPVVAIFIIFYLIALWGWPTALNAYHFNGEAPSAVDVSAGTRWVVWPQLIEAVLQRPWLGWGLGQVSSALNAVAHGYGKGESFTFAHNLVLDMAVGFGIPLTILIVLMALIWTWRRVKGINNFSACYSLAVVVPVVVHSMLEFPFAYAYFLAPAMYVLGTLDRHYGQGKAVQIDARAALASIAVVGSLMVWSAFEYIQIEEDFRIVRFESLRLGKTPVAYERPKVVLLTQLDALLHGGRVVPAPGMSADQLELSRKVALRFPWPATQNRYALSLALNGEIDEAARQLKVIRTLHGEKSYAQIKLYWISLAAEKHPQLQAFPLP